MSLTCTSTGFPCACTHDVRVLWGGMPVEITEKKREKLLK